MGDTPENCLRSRDSSFLKTCSSKAGVSREGDVAM